MKQSAKADEDKKPSRNKVRGISGERSHAEPGQCRTCSQNEQAVNGLTCSTHISHGITGYYLGKPVYKS